MSVVNVLQQIVLAHVHHQFEVVVKFCYRVAVGEQQHSSSSRASLFIWLGLSNNAIYDLESALFQCYLAASNCRREINCAQGGKGGVILQ